LLRLELRSRVHCLQVSFYHSVNWKTNAWIGAGMGGGGILVPLYIIIMGYAPRYANPLSNATMVGVGLASLSVNLRWKSPVVSDRY
jgi:hypothetical protein